MPAVERYFPRVRCPFCYGHEFVVQDGAIVPCACRPVEVGEEPPANLRAEVLARVAVTEQEPTWAEAGSARALGYVLMIVSAVVLIGVIALVGWLS